MAILAARDDQRRDTTPRPTLVCVPHAGGSATSFGRWVSRMRVAGVEVRPVQWGTASGQALPAANERPIGSVESRAAELAEAVGQLVDNWVLLGHSLGGIIAYETVRLLEAAGGTLPNRLVLCGAAAPGHHLTFGRGLSRAPDEEIVRYLRGLGGMPDELLGNPTILAPMLAQIRCELGMLEEYEPRVGEPIRVPVSLYVGRDDQVTVGAVERWRPRLAEVTVHRFDGGHFFLHDDLPVFWHVLTEECLADG
ncbi:thioesterase II family protein [Micromonospora sp. CA-263727]|uniref:thioesterase II family protein n=1 Tax=Micromonospora sp. CA-263727 TaxID=3239967 RepID=UPI003D8AE1F8